MSFQLISTVTVGSGGAASIDFNSIAGTYTDLKLVISSRSNRADVNDYFQYVKFNGSTTGYTARTLYGYSGTAYSGTSDLVFSQGNSATSNTFDNIEIYIPNYAGSTNKSLSIDAVTENNATANTVQIGAGLWSNTAAITSITLAPKIGTLLLQYSTASLYGITKGSGGATVS